MPPPRPPRPTRKKKNKTHQEHTDQFTCTRGKLQVAIADVREGSPTFGQVNSFVLGVQRPLMIQIPPGAIHGGELRKVRARADDVEQRRRDAGRQVNRHGG